MADRITQEIAEAGYRAAPPPNNLRITQELAEVGYRAAPPPNNLRITQAIVEVGYRLPNHRRRAAVMDY